MFSAAIDFIIGQVFKRNIWLLAGAFFVLWVMKSFIFAIRNEIYHDALSTTGKGYKSWAR